MSSPFSMLRKHQRILLVIFGVVAMITFTIGGIVTTNQERAGARAYEEPVVLWKKGKITVNDLLSIKKGHALIVQYLDALVTRTVALKGNPKGPGVTRDRQTGQIMDPGIPRSGSEQDLIRTELLAEKAKELGMVISDDAVLEFLDRLTDDVVKPRSEYGRILRESTHGQLPQQMMLEQLRKELLAQNVRLLATSGLLAITPGSAWEYFNRFNRRIKAEIFPVKVADYVADVKQVPGEDELKRLYDAGKERYPEPNSPDPGFKRRRQIAFQYAKADFNAFLKTEMAAVSDAEVKKYYEEHKKDYIAPELPPAEEKPESKKEPAGTAGAKPEAKPETKPDVKPEVKPAVKEEAKPETKPDVKPEAKPEVKPEAKAASEVAKPAEKPDAKPAPSGEKKEPEAKKPDNSSLLNDRNTFFVSLLADEPGPKDSGAKPAPAEQPKPAVEAKPADQAKPAEPKPAEPAKPAAEAKPTDQAKPAESPAGAKTEKPEVAPKADAAGKDKAEQKKDPGAEKPVKYKSLEEMSEQIRRDIASPLAQKKVEAAMKAVKGEVDTYFRERTKWNSRAKKDAKAEEFKPLKYEELAKKHGLVGGQTELLDEVTIGEHELGKTYRFGIFQRQVRTIPFAQIAYTEGLPLYKPAQIPDDFGFMADAGFVYWKIDEQEPNVPELNKIRDQVLNAWKLTQALELAKEAALKLAKEANAGKALKDVVGEKNANLVVETGEFSWLTLDGMPMGGGMPSLSRVDGVQAAGRQFMEAAFELKPGQSGVAVNQPQTMVYVVRVVSESPNEDTRRQQFLASGVTGETFFQAAMERQQILEDWNANLEKEMQLKWQRPPQQVSQASDL